MSAHPGPLQLGRRTRSGAVFSPWEAEFNATYRVPVDVGDFLEKALESGLCDVEEDKFHDPAAEAAPVLESSDRVPGCSGVAPSAPYSSQQEDQNDRALVPSTKSQAERRKERQRENRRKGRMEKQRLLGTNTKEVARKRILQARLEQVSEDLSNSRHASTGLFGLRPTASCTNKRVLALEEEGFRVVPWDDPSHSFAFVDSQGRMFLGGGSPKDVSGWEEVNKEACAAINSAREACSFSEKQLDHQRGLFPVLASGVSYGNGRKRPLNVKNTARNARALKKLFAEESLQRIVGLQNQLLHSFSPKLGAFYRSTLEAILQSQPELSRNFANSDFACITVNFGPVTETIDHVDRANLAAGLCAVTALGDFDPKQGGHLILWDLKLILEFPPGATILLPSALLRHSNTPLDQPACQRFSVTQYSPGGALSLGGKRLLQEP
ncbi:hypothetical protein ONZ45_g16758 [Pleurotus djamor]|nr:hypothetical protein ONZ45_g16758 [Pleurotus djamor]